jgi:hypothetical protein
MTDAEMIAELEAASADVAGAAWHSTECSSGGRLLRRGAVGTHPQHSLQVLPSAEVLEIVLLHNNRDRLIELAKIGMRATVVRETSDNALIAFDRLTNDGGTDRGMWLYEQLGGPMEELRGLLAATEKSDE